MLHCNGYFKDEVSFFRLIVQQLSGKGEQLQLLQQQYLQTQQKLQLIQQQVRDMFLQCTGVCILIGHVLSQVAKEGEVVQLQHQLLETNTERTQLDGECHNVPKPKNH